MLKKFVTLFSIATSMVLSANSQSAITLTENDIISVGETAYLVTDTTPLASISTQAMKSGANVTWDFSALHSQKSDQIDFYTPSSTTFGPYYPQANLCAITQSSGYSAYFNVTTNSFVMTGLAGDLLNMGFNVKSFFSPGQTLMEFPSTYQSTYNAPYTATAKEYYGQYETVVVNGFSITLFVDSVSAKYEYSVSSEIDGYGTVITPDGTYGALRQKLVETEVDSQYVYVQGMGWLLESTLTYTTNRLRWWANGVGYALVECKYNPNNSKIKGEVQYVAATNPVVTSIAGIDFDDEISIFPNPASDQIKFSNLSANVKEIVVLDITGKEVNKINIENNNTGWTLVTSSYTNGMYLYDLIDTEGNCIQKGKFNILH